MMQSYHTSPLMQSEDADQPWIIWEQRRHVTSLNKQEQTESRYVNEDEEINVAYHSSEQTQNGPPLIQRKQYNAILSRMNQAAGKTGNFSAWNG